MNFKYILQSMWKHVDYFCKKNPNRLFNEHGELHCRLNRKSFSIKLCSLYKFLYLNVKLSKLH